MGAPPQAKLVLTQWKLCPPHPSPFLLGIYELPETSLASPLGDPRPAPDHIPASQWGPRWGSHFPQGGHAAETQAGGIGESGGHSWPTTSRKAGAGQTLDAEEPRDSVGCLAVGSGPTPRGKEGSLHGPEAIEQEVWQRQSLQSRCQGQGGQTNRMPQSWRSHHRPIFL